MQRKMKVQKSWLLSIIMLLCGIIALIGVGGLFTSPKTTCWANKPQKDKMSAHEAETEVFPSFSGAVTSMDVLQSRTPRLAEQFYTDILTSKVQKQKTPEFLKLVPGGYSNDQLRLIQKALVVQHAFGNALFKDCLMTYLVWDLLEDPLLNKKGIKLYLSRPRNKFINKKPEFVFSSHAADTLWEAIRYRTCQYDVQSREAFKRWWNKHKGECWYSWAQAKVDPIVASEGIPTQEKRKIAFFVTRNISAAVPREWCHFEKWWKEHRDKTGWQRDLIEKAIGNLQNSHAAVRMRARDQIMVIVGADIWHEVTWPPVESPAWERWAKNFQQWWEKRKNNYDPKPLTRMAVNLWEMYQSKKIHKMGEKDPTRLPQFSENGKSGESSSNNEVTE